MNRGIYIVSALIVLLLGACVSTPEPVSAATEKAVAAPDAAHREAIESWRQGRVARLTAPEGWLSLVGLHWLDEGDWSIGADAANAIQLAAGPARLGAVRRKDGAVWFRADAAAGEVTVSDAVKVMTDDQGHSWQQLSDGSATGKPTVVRAGTLSFVLIERGDRFALRVRDSESANRRNFSGIDYYDIDGDFRVEGRFVPATEPTFFDIQTVIGTVEQMPSPGRVEFELLGQPYVLHPVLEEGVTDWFFIFADRTNGRETYGPGRFMYAQPAVDGKVLLDFNKAYNPPCAFSEFSTCPLPPPENRLDLRVSAGEKKYRGPGH